MFITWDKLVFHQLVKQVLIETRPFERKVALILHLWRYELLHTTILNGYFDLPWDYPLYLKIVFLKANFHRFSEDTSLSRFVKPSSNTYEAKYSRMDQVKFVEDSLWRIWSDMVCFTCQGQILIIFVSRITMRYII